ncbi:MAG: hypothetical protein AAF513_17365 [Pseudomonadota bacterium]
MINRAVLLLKYKEAAIRWINEADPSDDIPGITLEEANEERIVYLIPEDVAESPQALRSWVQLNLDALFVNELEGWYTEESLWPKKRNMKLFDQWFDLECHTIVINTHSSPIIDDDI